MKTEKCLSVFDRKTRKEQLLYNTLFEESRLSAISESDQADSVLQSKLPPKVDIQSNSGQNSMKSTLQKQFQWDINDFEERLQSKIKNMDFDQRKTADLQNSIFPPQKHMRNQADSDTKNLLLTQNELLKEVLKSTRIQQEANHVRNQENTDPNLKKSQNFNNSIPDKNIIQEQFSELKNSLMKEIGELRNEIGNKNEIISHMRKKIEIVVQTKGKEQKDRNSGFLEQKMRNILRIMEVKQRKLESLELQAISDKLDKEKENNLDLQREIKSGMESKLSKVDLQFRFWHILFTQLPNSKI